MSDTKRTANEIVAAATIVFYRSRQQYLRVLGAQFPEGCRVRVWFNNGTEYSVDARVLWAHTSEPGYVEIENMDTGKRRHFHVGGDRWERL
ncbi:hypothetical protein [Candidatus Methylomirabilis sp.]|uniref:hypothetical protein n=1 Tax=Candidatus Methylomirabilis sp. TaxID=2032687 RepID=UPI003C755147